MNAGIRRLVCASAAALATLAAPALRAEPDAPVRHHIELAAMAGPAFPRCSPSCPEVKAGYALGASGMLRLSRDWAMGAWLNRAYFPWTPAGGSAEHATTTLGLLAFRWYAFEFDRVDPYLELDLGGNTWGATGAHSSSPAGGASLGPALGADVLALSGVSFGVKASYTFALLNKTGYADLPYNDGPRIPPITGIFQLWGVVTFDVGPALAP